MSQKMLREVAQFGGMLAQRDDDTLRRLAYAAPRGVVFGEVFQLPKDWHKAIPIYGGLPGIADRTGRERIASLVAEGLLEVSGRMVRLKLPAMEPVFGVQASARRKVSALWAKAKSSAASVSYLVQEVRSLCGLSPDARSRSSGGFRSAIPCFLIEDLPSVADEGRSTDQKSGAASFSGEREAADFGYARMPERADGWQERGSDLVASLFPALRQLV